MVVLMDMLFAYPMKRILMLESLLLTTEYAGKLLIFYCSFPRSKIEPHLSEMTLETNFVNLPSNTAIIIPLTFKNRFIGTQALKTWSEV